MKILYILLIIQLSFQCQHPIFCHGQILQTVQLSGIFPDSKTFVDMPLSKPVDQVLKNFAARISIKQFLQQNFLDPSSILIKAELEDWQQKPSMFDLISDATLRQFAYYLNTQWKSVAMKFSLRQLKASSSCVQNCSSILEVMDEKMFIAPGGRFRQCYYWDTFWIIKGLIASEMYATAQMIIRNFFLVIQEYGFVPNGMRLYYLSRSQPPFLGLMVKELATAYRMHFRNLDAMRLQNDAFQYLIKEHEYWMQTHSRNVTVGGRVFTLNFYNANTSQPRPESFKQDYLLTQNMTSQKRQLLLKNIASAAESGWDFSSRWFSDYKNLNTTRTTELNPTDLNTILGLTQQVIAQIASQKGNVTLYTLYTRMYKVRLQYFKLIQQNGLFPDQKGQAFYPSSLYPYMLFENQTAITFGDIVSPPASLIQTGQQWDYPNVWAPNVWILMEVSQYEETRKTAQKWVDTVYCGYIKYRTIFQKYNSEKLGERGEGGQYIVQQGFGWTNGLVLDLMVSYGQDLKTPRCTN